MATDKQNLQDAFLNHVRKTKVPVTIFLVNGVKLQGVITWFDSFCVLLRRDGQSQLVYKHAISTIMPGAPINLYEGEARVRRRRQNGWEERDPELHKTCKGAVVPPLRGSQGLRSPVQRAVLMVLPHHHPPTNGTTNPDTAAQ